MLAKVLEAGRYVIPRRIDWGSGRTPLVEVVLVDMRERDLTIKGQEILTADKVAIRVSIVVQFRVVDPQGGPACRGELRGPALQRRAARGAAIAGVDDARGDPHQPQPPERGHPA